jgi:hypothetical protein
MPITNASAVLDLTELAPRTQFEGHKLRMLAIIGDKTIPERVAIMLQHNIKIFNEADSIETNERYLVAMIEALIEANIEHVAEIAEYAAEYFEAQRKAPAREYLPYMIVALLSVATKRKEARNWKAGEKIPGYIGILFRELVTTARERELRISSLMTGRLSQLLADYVKTRWIAQTIIDEVGSLTKVPKCLHEIMSDLTHRLFGLLSFEERIVALRTAVQQERVDGGH